MKDKKSITITNAFQKILDESSRRPNKMWVDKDNKFYNRSMTSWLEKNATEMYLTHNERKFIVSERFIRTLNNKIYKYIISISKIVYIYKLNGIINKYNNIYHRTTKMKSVDVKPSIYIDFSKENHKEGPKFDQVRISKEENIFAKCYVPNWSGKVSVIKKVKNIVSWTFY